MIDRIEADERRRAHGAAVSQPQGAPETTPRPPLNVKVRSSVPLAASATVDPVLRFALGDLHVRAVSVVDATVQPLLVDQSVAVILTK